VYYFTENHFERAVLEVLQEHDYEVLSSGEVTRDYRNPLYMDALEESLFRLNRELPAMAFEEAIRRLQSLDAGTLIQKNRQFTDWLQNGMEVSFEEAGETVTRLVRLVDYDNVGNNSFTAINQWTVQGATGAIKRPDIVIFVNGLPVVVVELKSGSREEVSTTDAYLQLRNYMQIIPELFWYNLLFAPLGRELGGFSEWIFEVDPFIIAGELEQPQNIRWDIVRQMALYMVIIGQIDNLNRVEHIQQYTGCWAV